MKVYKTDQIRNVALAGHSSAGKTSVAEAILFERNHIDRMGRTEDGNTQSDFLPEETRRQISISASVLPVETGNNKINLVDLPGFRDFVGEIKGGMRICGGLVIVVDAVSGVEVGTEFALEYAREMELPVAFFINKLDKENASYEQALESIRAALPDQRLIEMAIPIGSQQSLSGVVDLIKMKAVLEKDGKVSSGEIPAELADRAAELREIIVDEAASDDDALAEKFLGGEDLSHEEIIGALKHAFVERHYFPVFAGSAVHALGMQSLTDFIETGFPNPNEAHGIHLINKDTGEDREIHFTDQGPTIVYIYKTISDKFGEHSFFKVVTGVVTKDTTLTNLNSGKQERLGHIYVQRGKSHEEVPELHAGDLGAVTKLQTTHTNDTLASNGCRDYVPPPDYPAPTVTMAIEAESRSDEDKLGEALKKLCDLDPTLTLRRDPVLAQTLIGGMGDMHLEVLHSRLHNNLKINCHLKTPRTAYRETIQATAEGMYRHKKQSGGRGQFGEVHLRLMPNAGGEGLDFRWKIVGGVIPSKYESAVRKGVEQAMDRGIVAGYPVVDVIVECFDGKQHDVDSSDMAFQIASSMGFQRVAQDAKPIILEPIMKLRTTVPEQYMGDVMGDVSSRRGKILGQEMDSGKVTVEALVPQAELYAYSKDLRSMTQGRGMFEMEFDHYERVPGDVQAKLAEEHERERHEAAG